jgi:hypothetical protein|uniref:MORN repeat protein n=1 Tax=viral metagenome TaxID=1070528 RepID=A0A6C0CVR6_9ZZZZ
MSKNIEYKIIGKKTTEELPPLDDTYYEPDTTFSLIKQQIKEYLLKKYKVNINPEHIKLKSKSYKSNAQHIPDIEISTVFKNPTSKDNVITFEIENNDESNIPNIAEIRTSREKTYTDINGNRFTYSGEKDDDGYPNRYGIIKYISGDNLGNEYFGMFNEKYLPNGEGRMTIHSHLEPIQKYSGTFSNGQIQPNNVTIIYKPNNENNYMEYNGNIKNSFGIRPHGYGKMILNNLDEYVGDFALGLYEYGSMYYKNGNIKVYSGSWEHGKPNAYGRTAGHGIIIDNKNNRYEGDVIDGVYEGYGTMEYNDGSNRRLYHGMWSKGQPSYGEMTYRDNSPPYEGPWKNGEPNPPQELEPISQTATPQGSPDRRRGNSPPKISRKKGGRIVTRKYRNQKKRRTTVGNKKSKIKKVNKSRKHS